MLLIIKIPALLLGTLLGLVGCVFHGFAWLFYSPAVKLLRYGLTDTPPQKPVEPPAPDKPPEG